MTVIEVSDLTKRYRDTLALDGVNLTLAENTIYGLLGRNGAGKTTLMSILTAQNFATSGRVRVFGQDPFENPAVLSRMCFVRESQKYPDDATPRHALRMARLFFPRWDQDLADELVDQFQLPMKRTIKKLSRGQLSMVGVIIGLASRAELTFFDEPYLGLDATARQIFYDRLLADYAEHPRTVVLSSHLIDEVANLIERVILIDRGAILLDDDTDAVRDRATTIVGDAAAVDASSRAARSCTARAWDVSRASPSWGLSAPPTEPHCRPRAWKPRRSRCSSSSSASPSSPPRAPRHPRKESGDEPYVQCRPHAARQQADLRLGAGARARRCTRDQPRRVCDPAQLGGPG